MAKSVKFKLVIQSSSVGTDRLDFLVEENPAVEAPNVNLATAAAPNGSQVVILGGSHAASVVYVKNLDTTNKIFVKNQAGHVLSEISKGNFALLEIPLNTGLEFEADTAPCEVEYGYWSKA